MARKYRYSLTELYGWHTHVPSDRESHWDVPKPCYVCGAAVLAPYAHQTWHQNQFDDSVAITTLNARVALQEQGKLF